MKEEEEEEKEAEEKEEECAAEEGVDLPQLFSSAALVCKLPHYI